MVDAAAGVVWAAVTAGLVSAAWRLGRATFPSDTTFEHVFHTVVIGWSACVAAGVVLGAVGLLTPWNHVAAMTAVAGGLWRAAGRTGRVPNPTVADSTPHRSKDAEWWYLWAWGGVAAVWVARVAVIGLSGFPTDWDSLNYHLPVIHCWLRGGSLYAPACNEWWVPGTNELVGLWLSGVFSGDYLAAFTNIPAVAVLALGTVELGRVVGLPMPVRHAAGLVMLTTNVVTHQALTQKNDIAAVALFAAAMSYVLRHVRHGPAADAILAATSIGLLAGVKYYAFGYAVVAALTWVGCRWAGTGYRAAARAGVLAIAVGGTFGGYWYARNVIVSGTPLFPKGVGRSDVLSNWRPQGTWESTLLGNGSPEVFPLLLRAVYEHSGPAVYGALLLTPAASLYLLFGGIGGRRSDLDLSRFGLAAALLGSGLVWGVIPFAVEIRPGTLHFLRGGYLPIRFGLCELLLCVIAIGVPLGDIYRSLGSLWGRVLACVLLSALFAVISYEIARHHKDLAGSYDIATLAVIAVSGGLVVREIRLYAPGGCDGFRWAA